MMPRLAPSTVKIVLAVIALLTAFTMYGTWKRSVELDAANGNPRISSTPWPDMRVNLNAASAAELSVLPGVGPMLAERIVDDRASRGTFESIDDVDRVHGIGPAIIARLRPYAVVDEPSLAASAGSGVHVAD